MNDTAADLDLTPPAKAPKAPKGEKAAKAPKAPKEPKAPRVSRLKAQYPDDAKFTLLVEGNPKRGASKDRFEAYIKAAGEGKTGLIKDAVAGGVTYADLAWDVGHGLISVEKAA